MKTVKYIKQPNGKKVKVVIKKERNLMLEALVNDFSLMSIELPACWSLQYQAV